LNKPYVKDTKFNNSLVGRKLFKEHLFTVSDTDYVLFLSPVFEFLGGQDQEANKNYLTNSRGVWAGGVAGAPPAPFGWIRISASRSRP
jgi:hypothetical protein